TIRVFMPQSKADSIPLAGVAAEVRPDSARTEPAFTITPTVVTDKEETNPVSGSISTTQPDNDKKMTGSVITEKSSPPASQVFIIRSEAEKEESQDKKDASIIVLPGVSTTTTNSDCKNL